MDCGAREHGENTSTPHRSQLFLCLGGSQDTIQSANEKTGTEAHTVL